MAVVLIGLVLAWHRTGPRGGSKVPLEFAVKLDGLHGMIGSIESRLVEIEESPHTLGAIVNRANDLTKDMLAMKTMLAEHREAIGLLRTKNSLRALGGAQE